MTPAARRWLGEVFDSMGESAALPLIVVSLADRARGVSAGQSEEIASVRLLRRSGGWLVAHASVLDEDANGRVAVMVAPARDPEIAT
jgi:hypothetical protein